MTKKFLLTSLLAAFVAARASAVSIVDFQPNTDGLVGADVTFTGLASDPQASLAVAPGLTLSYNNAVIVQNTTNGVGAKPYPFTGGDYLSIKAGGVADFLFSTGAEKLFGFQWGSVDRYNSISFLLGGILQGSFTGSQVVNSPVAANGAQGLNGSAYVTFSGIFDQVRLNSSSNSFEIDNVRVQNVPDSGVTLALFGAALLGLTFFRRFAA